MAKHLLGMHDWSPDWGAMIRDADRTAWAVISESIGDDPNDRSGHDYSALAAFNVTPIVRLNYSHHGQGTIPLPNRYDAFAERCANFVSASPGCRHWILGNETNWSVERPGGVAITPRQYADCFDKCQRAIKYRSAHHHVIVAAVAPYNVETGPWLDYWREMLIAIAGDSGADGLALHFYSRGADPGSIRSDTKMDAPFGHLYNGFRAYRDLLAMVPDDLRHLPAYATETNQLQPWADTNSGWVQAAYAEIDEWNADPSHQPIKFLALYRWETYDQFGIKGKSQLLQDFRAAAAKGYKSPFYEPPGEQINAQNYSKPEETYLPDISSGPTPVTVPEYPADWDPRLTERGVRIQRVHPGAPGTLQWRVTKGCWLDESESGGRHHFYANVYTGTGERVIGAQLSARWPGDGYATFPMEDKPASEPGANFPMSPSLNEFSFQVNEPKHPSDVVTGVGMGADGNPGIHTSTLIEWTLNRTSEQKPMPQQPATVPALAHPILDPTKRRISQRFGANPDAYARFGMAGHTGLDFAVPTGTPVRAVDDGKVIQASHMDDYGNVIKLQHAWGESVYAHLDTFQMVTAGHPVQSGEVIALSGNTGNSTGPHLHFAMRVNPYRRGAPYDGYTDPEPYLSGASTPQGGPNTPLLPIVKRYAAEFGLDWRLVASLIMAESSFDPRAESAAGAKGLMQIMPATFAEWAERVGASDIWSPDHNIKVGCAYLAWLLRRYKDSAYKAVIAYNFGPGNVDKLATPPQATIAYVGRVLFGRDLLKAVGS